jgi:hypothetical protein
MATARKPQERAKRTSDDRVARPRVVCRPFRKLLPPAHSQTARAGMGIFLGKGIRSMPLLTFLADLRAARIVDEITQNVARQTYGTLRQICERRVLTMTHAEARGYVWAKARPVVATEVAAVAVVQPTISPRTLHMLSERTHDRLVQSVVSDLMRERAEQKRSRRAA